MENIKLLIHIADTVPISFKKLCNMNPLKITSSMNATRNATNNIPVSLSIKSPGDFTSMSSIMLSLAYEKAVYKINMPVPNIKPMFKVFPPSICVSDAG